MRYNGWENRETWLVNLYFGDVFGDEILELLKENSSLSTADVAEYLEDLFEDLLSEETTNLSDFIMDYIDFDRINWNELADVYLSDAKHDLELEKETK